MLKAHSGLVPPYGLSRFKDGKFANYTARDGLGSNSVRAITQDTNGRLWFGTLSGLSLPVEGTSQHIGRKTACLVTESIALYPDKDGGLRSEQPMSDQV